MDCCSASNLQGGAGYSACVGNGRRCCRFEQKTKKPPGCLGGSERSQWFFGPRLPRDLRSKWRIAVGSVQVLSVNLAFCTIDRRARYVICDDLINIHGEIARITNIEIIINRSGPRGLPVTIYYSLLCLEESGGRRRRCLSPLAPRRTERQGAVPHACPRTDQAASLSSALIAVIRVPRYKPTFPARGIGSCRNLQLSISSTPSTPSMPLLWAIRFSRR